MKKIKIPFFLKSESLRVDIPVKMKNTQFSIRMDMDKKHDIVYFYIISKMNRKFDDITISAINQAYIEYLNNYVDLHLWNIKRIFYLLHKLITSRVFDFKKMKRIDVITSSSSTDDKITKNIARTIKQNGKIITIIDNNELKNQLVTNFMSFHYLNFKLLNALVSIDLVSLLNDNNKNIIKNVIGISMAILLNLPTLHTIFTCILKDQISYHFFDCIKIISSNIFFIDIVLSIISPILWFILPKIIQFIFKYYFTKILKKYVLFK